MVTDNFSYNVLTFILLVALCVAEVRHDYGNRACACALECVDPEEDLYQFIIGVHADRLDEVYITVSYSFLNSYKNITVGKMDYLGVAHFGAQIITHFLCKTVSAFSGKNLNISLFAMHVSYLP